MQPRLPLSNRRPHPPQQAEARVSFVSFTGTVGGSASPSASSACFACSFACFSISMVCWRLFAALCLSWQGTAGTGRGVLQALFGIEVVFSRPRRGFRVPGSGSKTNVGLTRLRKFQAEVRLRAAWLASKSGYEPCSQPCLSFAASFVCSSAISIPSWATARGRERYPAWPSWRGRKPVARLSPGGPASKFRGQASRGLEFRLRGEAVWG